MTPDSPLLTVGEVAEIVRQTPESVRRWVREGRMKAIKLPGGALRIRQSEVDRVLSGTPAPTEPVVGAA